MSGKFILLCITIIRILMKFLAYSMVDIIMWQLIATDHSLNYSLKLIHMVILSLLGILFNLRLGGGD
jgi:hypothetical protein